MMRLVFASFIHYALRSHANTLPKKAWEEAKLKPDEITQDAMGLDIEVKDIPLYIIEHYGDGKDYQESQGKFDKALALLKEVYNSRYSEERWNNLKDLDIAKSDEEKADVDFLIPNKPMYRIFEFDDMKEILGTQWGVCGSREVRWDESSDSQVQQQDKDILLQ